MKRLIVGLVTVVVLVGVGQAEGAMVFQDNFDSHTTNDPPGGWTIDAPSGTSVEVDDTVFSGASGKSVHILDQSVGGDAHVSHGFANISNYMLTYDMYTESKNHAPSVWAAGDVGGGGDYVVLFMETGDISILGGGPAITLLEDYKLDTWYTVERYLNLATDTGRVRVFETEYPLIGSEWYNIGNDGPNTYISRVIMASAVTLPGEGYIDNVRVSAIPEPSSLIIWGVGATCLAGYACRKTRCRVRVPMLKRLWRRSRR